MRYTIFLAIFLFLGCSYQTDYSGRKYPKNFILHVADDVLESLNGNTFTANIRGIHPVFGNAINIKVRGLSAKSITDPDTEIATLAFRQWHRFSELIKEAKVIELRDLERGSDGFWVWADVYIDGVLLQDAN
jgi:hypothetical protein